MHLEGARLYIVVRVLTDKPEISQPTHTIGEQARVLHANRIAKQPARNRFAANKPRGAR